ncbi:MAG: GC-type dockerin domain-anchored protein [Phycisphaerales bacterium]
MSRPLIIHLIVLVAAGLVLSPAPSYAQNSQPYWASTGPVNANIFFQTLVFNDGFGDGLYLMALNPGGGGGTYTGIFRWRSGTWEVIAKRGERGLSLYIGLYGMVVLDLDGTRSLYLYGADDARTNDPASGIAVNYHGWIKRWTGIEWVPTHDGLVVGPLPGETGMEGWPVMTLNLGDGPRVYGTLAQSLKSSYYDVTRWTGDNWEVIGAVTGGFGPLTLVPFDDGNGLALYAFGDFTAINGVQARRFAKWDGQQWHAPYPGLVTRESSDFNCVTFDDGSGPALYCSNGGGWINGQGPGFLNKWDGTTWSIIPSVIVPPKTLTTVNGIAVFDDGRGPALYITGGWGNVQGVAASGIARFDGKTWEPLGAGIPYPQHGPRPNSLQVMNDPRRGPSLFVGATMAGAGVVPKYAQWVGCPNCYADCDLDRTLTVADFVCYVNMFAAKDPYANCTVDATIDIADFICYQTKFAAGCGP